VTTSASPRYPDSLSALTLVTNADIVRRNAELTTDFNPIHLDPEFAARTAFKAPIIHGTMALNLLMQAIDQTFGHAACSAAIDVKFTKPVPVGATIRAGGALVDAAAGRDSGLCRDRFGATHRRGRAHNDAALRGGRRMYSSFPSILVDRPASGVLRLTLSKPDRLNALDADGHRELADIWRTVDRDKDALCCSVPMARHFQQAETSRSCRS